jgi:hypothetical protein
LSTATSRTRQGEALTKWRDRELAHRCKGCTYFTDPTKNHAVADPIVMDDELIHVTVFLEPNPVDTFLTVSFHEIAAVLGLCTRSNLHGGDNVACAVESCEATVGR